MRHLDDGALRRLIDEPLAADGRDREHLDGCPGCLERSRALAAGAAAVRSLLVPRSEPRLDLNAALAAVSGDRPMAAAHRRAIARWTLSLRPLARPLLLSAALLLIAAVGVAATPSLVTIFEPHQVTAVPVSRPEQATFAGLPDLSSYGTVEVVQRPESSTVLTAAEAATLSGLTPPAAPPEYAGQPATYQVIGRSEATFTFSAEKAKAAALAAGKPAPDFSRVKGIDRTKLTITIGPALAVIYGKVDKNTSLRNLPLVAAVSNAPVVTSTGASLKELEDFLVSQPGIAGNADLISQIRAIGDPLAQGSLPLPIPVEMARSEKVSVNGAAGVMITEKSEMVRAVVWERRDAASSRWRIYAVAGHFDADTIQSLARQLHQ